MASGRFSITVKDVNGFTYLVQLDSCWSVQDLKHEVSRQASFSPDSFELVFAGSVLKESQSLSSFGLQSYSTLHCIQSIGRNTNTEKHTTLCDVDLVSIPTTMALPGAAIDVSPPPATAQHCRDQFYVYCKAPSCNSMQPGKLRVRCANCKNAGFVLQNDPKGWSDILTPRKLHGYCGKHGCGGKDAEFYFKCGAHDTGEMDNCVALHMVRLNTVKVECAACCSTSEDKVVMFNTCYHCMCIPCFVAYCEDKVKTRHFVRCENIGYTLRCPASCPGSEVKEIHHFRLLGKELYDRYQQFGSEDCLLQMGGILCPQLNCGMGLLPETPDRRVQCPAQIGGCGFVFCRECKEAFHHDTCSQLQRPASTFVEDQQIMIRPTAQWQIASARYIRENTKPCPKCRVQIEKNGGCRHMTCRCGFEWCWICSVKWNGDCKSDHWFGDSDDDDDDGH